MELWRRTPEDAEEACEDEGDHAGHHRSGRSKVNVDKADRVNRRHRRTVSGVTMTRACLQPVQTLASPTHKRRSIVRNLGRGTVRLYTASCWCRAMFSRASWRWPAQRNGRSRSEWSTRVIIKLGYCPDQS